MVTVSVHRLYITVLCALSFLSTLNYTYIFCFQIKPRECTGLEHEDCQHCLKDDRYAEVFRKKERSPKHLKYILVWTRKIYSPTSKFGEKQNAFITNHCPVTDCFVTYDRKFFGGDLKNFDAIIFNGRILDHSDLPRKRFNYQKYIFVNDESAANYPVCHKFFDNFFNWTFTYRLDSDILLQYFQIRDMQDNIIGPKLHMKWQKINTDVDNEVDLRWKKKKTAVAWMVSHCETLNKRETLAKRISRQLRSVNLRLDIYGACGSINCKKGNDSCWTYIAKNYYFYLAFENSNSADYVTEKLLNSLQFFTIPIVYGGANYSRFLPPDSYLDATKLSVKNLVAQISEIISSKDLYKHYFKWRSIYKYTNASRENICALCSALHENDINRSKKSYKQFRYWWLPNYEDACERYGSKGILYNIQRIFKIPNWLRKLWKIISSS